MRNDRELVQLLHTLDRLPSDSLEYPQGFDANLALAKAKGLAERLSIDFSSAWRVAPNQDANYYFAVEPEDFESGPLVGIRLSNFGNLAAVTTPRPDSHPDLEQAVADGVLSPGQRDLIVVALDAIGYTLIPQYLLHRRYDGISKIAEMGKRDLLLTYPDDLGHAAWWNRFFEYI
ncbi:hypothetical protein ABT160_42680 [Streptomyces sp. NPDC001941]|uniref:hypothetical protein n=1 Tax=Streptomyces sp. NPDC001941 TaxID=3154659 RepID=UPI003321A64E